MLLFYPRGGGPGRNPGGSWGGPGHSPRGVLGTPPGGSWGNPGGSEGKIPLLERTSLSAFPFLPWVLSSRIITFFSHRVPHPIKASQKYKNTQTKKTEQGEKQNSSSSVRCYATTSMLITRPCGKNYISRNASKDGQKLLEKARARLTDHPFASFSSDLPKTLLNLVPPGQS